MSWRYTPLIIPIAIAGVLSLGIAIFAWRRRHLPGAQSLAALTLAASIWSLGYACELSSADLASSIFWAKAEYLGIVAVPVAWLAFALQYTNHEQWLTGRKLLLLLLMPLVTLLLAWTNERHGLIWSAINLDASGMHSVFQV